MNGPAIPRGRGDDPLWRTAWGWLCRAHDGPLSDAEQAGFRAWLHEDAAHRQCYDEALKLWAEASLVPTIHVDPDPDVPLDLDALRQAFHGRGGSSSEA
ncbi:hypothetical protein CDN99_10955 [Roseateles aquatilis]|uniref:FecR N-terminal domain-containing protein n=1 Tax=Roseateles aquatilis TaxID=431061 RepID=A0A246JEK3_9BURK|nr:FecR/PupR family sigma factor regulator [Roseateles aquatilis]OWQ91001.1 hypothetical protein CDN99_10955 [Roseateles aquatilis]